VSIVPDPDLVDRLAARRAAIEERIRVASGAPSFAESGVRLIAVSKTHPAETIVAAAAAGFAEFGESYAVEFAAKAPEVGAAVRWHFIGQLQTNKVRVVAPWTDVYQSVDRPSLVAELAKRVPGATVMVQVNLADVEGRGGVSWQDAPGLIESARVAGLSVVGAMGVAPLADDATVAAAFGRLRSLCDAEALPECSIGMSGDLEIAIAEGSTMVRVGTDIFGSRP